MASDSISVLVATGSPELAGQLRSKLERAGHEVEVVDSGADVLAADGAPDLILLDLELPGMDGLSVLNELRGAGRATPVVLLKGEDEPAHLIQRGFDLGASGYLRKSTLDGRLSKGVDLFRELAPHEQNPQVVSRTVLTMPDACPYSASGDFRNCAAFVPIDVMVGDDSTLARTSCSHFPTAPAAGWGPHP